jgi:hypothetical protein
MFDEVNEGTAIFKVATDQDHQPSGVPLVSLAADGRTNVSSDTFLRIGGRSVPG